MRISYDSEADAAYIYLTEESLTPGRETVPCNPPGDPLGTVAMDWKDGMLVGLEILDASKLLHRDLLAMARPPGH